MSTALLKLLGITFYVLLTLLLCFGWSWERVDALDGGVPPVNGRTLPACTSEDGSYGPVPCVWLAVQVNEMPAVGNGTGDSFRIYRSGRVKVITDRRAYQLLHGMPNHDRLEAGTS